MAGPGFWGYTHKPAQTLGTRLGGDFANVLEGLAQQKAQGMKVNENKKFLQSLGIRPDVASGLARQPDDFIQKFLGQYEGFDIGNSGQQQQQQQQYNMSGLQPQQEQNGYQNQPNQMQNSPQLQPLVSQNLPQNTPYNEAESNQVSAAQVGQLLQNQATQQALNPQQNQQQVPKRILSKAEAEAERKVRADQLKELHEERKFNREQEAKEVKESKDWYKAELAGSHSLKENLARLSRMEKINKSGKLNHNLLTSIRDTIGHGIGGKFGTSFIGIPGIDLTSVLLSPESQEFEKLSKDMLSGLSDMYKGRVNQVEVESFLKTIPSLLQSSEGRQAVIENMRRFTEDKLLAVQQAKAIKDANAGKIPADLQIQVEENIGSRLDKTIEDFKNLTHSNPGRNEDLLTSTIKSLPRLLI